MGPARGPRTRRPLTRGGRTRRSRISRSRTRPIRTRPIRTRLAARTAPARTSRLAIAALVTGLLGMVPVATGLAIGALVRAGRRGERGRGLAVGGLVASAAWVVAGVVGLVALGSLLVVDRDGSGRVTGEDKMVTGALQVGDCFNGFQGENVPRLVTAVPCTRPHEGEAVAKLRIPGREYPGDAEVEKRADHGCDLKTEHLWKSRYAADLQPYVFFPSRSSWTLGDREVVCLLRYTGSESLTAPLGRTLDPSLRLWHELAPRDCMVKWDEESIAQRTVPCTEPHRIQVFARYALKPGPYPGEKALDRSTDRGCDKRYLKVFRGGREPDLLSTLYPSKEEWESGHRTAVCLGESEKTLKRPMLPPH